MFAASPDKVCTAAKTRSRDVTVLGTVLEEGYVKLVAAKGRISGCLWQLWRLVPQMLVSFRTGLVGGRSSDYMRCMLLYIYTSDRSIERWSSPSD
jgi:hypothetical protein